MDKGYEVYCLADPFFYDSPTVTRGDDVDFERAQGPDPDGWARAELDDWLMYAPEGAVLRSQGWKVHASACLDNADEILAAVWDYCIPRRIPFKFIRSKQLLFLGNMKYAHRGSSGKFVTIYPADDSQFELLLMELGAILEGQPGPYILSDLRWDAGPLYVRYGGFAERYCVGPNGELELAIEDGDGKLIPDRRGPAFEVPTWVTLPNCLAPHLAARNRTTIEDLPYRIEDALHFSNGGGVYLAVDNRSGERVVLKEARPHAGLAMDGADAVTRLGRERDILERLAGLGLVPRVRDYFTVGEHHFLVQDFVDGTKLTSLFVERYPLTASETDKAAADEYTSWALDVYGQVEGAVTAAHEAGVVIGDLHPSNVLVQPDGRVVLIDLEGGSDVGENREQILADASFLAPRGHSGFDIDRYALACLRLYLFMPLTSLVGLQPAKAEQLATEIANRFPVPREFISEAAETISGAWRRSGRDVDGAGAAYAMLGAGPPDWGAARVSMSRAILSSATPQRNDRLFPGDVKQFPNGGINIAYGAAGVLYALDATGGGRHSDLEEWLVERALHPKSGTSPGFYDGLHGVAYVLDQLDRRGDALRVLEISNDDIGGNWERLGLDLYAGLAGIGLNLAYFAEATGDPSLWDATWQVAEVVASRLGEEDSVPEVSGGDYPYAGLTRGSSGPALMFLRLYEHSGDSELLDLARTALLQDLRRCISRDDGSLEVNEGWRTMPYLGDGSVGIGMVLDDYLARQEDERLKEAADSIRKAAEGEFYIEPGLFWGRAGMILYLSRKAGVGAGHKDPAVAAHVGRLAWHAMTYRGHLAFPGEQLLRLSMDLGTGTAGILLALGAALHDAPVHLPFLGPLRAEHHAREPVLLVNAERR